MEGLEEEVSLSPASPGLVSQREDKTPKETGSVREKSRQKQSIRKDQCPLKNHSRQEKRTQEEEFIMEG